jgi:hypothetical protein
VKPDFAQYGFAHQDNLIMACTGGSQAHGAKLDETDDTVFRLPSEFLGLSARSISFSRPEANPAATARKMWTFACIP